jgi:hypothetical protein
MPQSFEQAEAGYRNIPLPREIPNRTASSDMAAGQAFYGDEWVPGLAELAKRGAWDMDAGFWEASTITGDE